MQLRQYGLVLESLRPAYLELLREWRNAPDIRQHMEFQEYISPEMQSQWFKRIHTIENYYFVILVNDRPVGLIHLSSLNDQTGQAGLFIGQPSYQASTVPIRASLCLLDFAFNHLKLGNVRAKVKRDNLKAIQYNSALGFKAWKATKHPDFQWMRITKQEFERQTLPLKRAAALLGEPDFQLTIEEDQALDLKIKADLQRRHATLSGDS
ncbi:MAG TPA: GNAT family N-acetyltransferase [Saprospiraceae bacterium]|nr:GNAT family N-acetyltransferase [Saprospiraceae bacterium]